MAQIHLRTGSIDQAEEQARHALRLLEAAGNEDYIDEVGSAQLVLGRALLEQSRLDEAEAAFASAESCFALVSHCYRRPTYDDWPYSIFTMVHGKNARDCEETSSRCRPRPASTSTRSCGR